MDFFAMHVQNVILNIVKQFFGSGIWNKNTKHYASVIVSKCEMIDITEDSPWIKPLECLSKLIHAIDDMDFYQEDLGEGEDVLMSDGSADIDNTAKIVEELIPETLISKWMNQLSIKDENATGEKLKAITLVLEIIDNFCKTSPKISLQLLKEGIMEIVIKYLPSNFQKDKMSQTGSQHSSDNSELSELEEFKIGNGGQATTSYHTTRKNSLRTKSAEMSQSQISLCNSIMRTLLSLDVDPTIPSHVEIETEYNELLHSAKMQQLLSEIVFIIFYSKGAVNQKTQMDNCITLEKIITLLDPEVIAENFSKSKMSRQTRALLINSLKAINPSAADGRSEHDLSFRIMSRMPQSNVGSLFSIQNLQNTEKPSHESLPPFGYIQSQISSPDKAKGEPRPDPNSKAKPKEDYKQSLAYKVKLIKDADGGLDYLERLTHISKVLKDDYSSINECRECFVQLREMLANDGLTSYEIIESKLIESLHKFLMSETDFEKKMIERILLFKNEIIDHSSHSSKSVNITQQLIECFNNVINDDELIEDLHMVSRGYDQFFMKNIFTELEQVKLQINFMEISSEERPQPQANTNVMSTFMQSMSTFENPNNANKTEGLVKKEVLSEKTTEAEKFYKKMKRMVIVAPADMTFESLGKFISRKITNYNELESNYCKRSNNVYVEQHSYRDYEQPSRVNHFSNPFLKSSQRLPRTIEFLNNFHKMKFNSKKGKFGANTLSKRFGKVEPFNFGILINKNKEAEKNEEPAEQQPQENEKLSSENYDGENEDGENDDIEHEDIQNDGNDHDDIEDESNEDEDSEDDHDIDDDDNDDHDHDEDDDDEEANKYFEDDESEEDNPSHSKGSQKSKPIIHQIPIYEEMDDEDSSDEIDNIKIAKMPFMDAENDDMMIIPDEPVFPEIEFDDEDRIIFEPPDVVKIEPSEIVNTLPKQPLKGNFTIDFTTPRSEPIDGKVTIGNWVKQNVKNIKMKRVPDSFLSGFSQYRLRNANMLQFSLKEVSEDQLNKDENSEEDIDFGVSNFFRGNRVYEKYNRTYSLFLQKIDSKEQSIQIRELHRLLEKELQSSQIIKDEI